LFEILNIIETPFFGLILLPILIFSARIGDVSLGTLRIIFITQGKRVLAPLVGFFEVFIWLLAMGQIFNNLTNIIYYVAYAGGFAFGNYIGLVIENKISLGLLSIHLIVRQNQEELLKLLAEKGYSMTILPAQGSKGSVSLIVLIIERKNEEDLLKIVKSISPNAFISIEKVQSIAGGNLPHIRKTHWYLLKRKKAK
jgi:uncharacterized protein YebE (UPF0316 family)